MADSRSVMQEFRFLEQKRQAGSLTPAETARHAELRDLVGFEPPLPARGGFDVTAAAAQLRESLLPAGLRSRPAPPPPPEPPAVAEPPAPRPEPVAAPPPAETPFFDPATLGQEVRPQAWNPEAPGYDPDAPYDEAAWIAAGYDPSVTYDWSAAGEPATPAEQPAEPVPLQFGEYDAPGTPLPPSAPEAPPPPPAPEAGAAWFDDAGEPPPAPPLPEPAFGDYDATPALVLEPEPDGSPAGPALPGEARVGPGGTPPPWFTESATGGSFELASRGSFGEQTPPVQAAPWTAFESDAPAEPWESPAALDPAAPLEPAPGLPAAGPPEELDPEEALEPLPEPPLELVPEPSGALPLEPLPEEPAEAEPVSLDDLDTAVEIDVPPEIAAAYESPPDPSTRLAFDAPEPAVLPTEVVEAEVEPLPAQPPAAAVVVGTQRVVVHTLDGEVLRGTLSDARLEAPELELDTGAPGATTLVATAGVKAIFFMLAPGEQAPSPQGQRVRVAFRDGRQVAGFSPDYREGLAGFFVIPADSRTNTGRIWVYQAAVKQVTAS
jgi:hypothetical protein